MVRKRQAIESNLLARACARATGHLWTWGTIGIALILTLSGCNSFGNSRLVKELQSENERLLGEFRGQRDRATELEKANRQQAERLAESEKLLARLSQGTSAGRLSSLPQTNLPAVGPNGSPSSFGANLSGNALKSPPSPSASGLSAPANSAPSTSSSTSPSELRWQPRYNSRP